MDEVVTDMKNVIFEEWNAMYDDLIRNYFLMFFSGIFFDTIVFLLLTY